MIVTRICSALLIGIAAMLGSLGPASAQSKTNSPGPRLPVVTKDACPGKDRIVPRWKIKRPAQMFASWSQKSARNGTLDRGDEVTVMAGVSVTRKPDRISVTRPFADLSLKAGDVILRYGTDADGNADIWVQGQWHKKYDLSRTTEKDGTGCQSDQCDSVVVEDGIKEWWVQVKTGENAVGWVLGFKSSLGKFSDSGNFDGLCLD